MTDPNYNNTQYYQNSQRYTNYNPYNRVPRGWLLFAQIAGTIVSVIGLIIYISYMQKLYHALPSSDLTKKSVIALLLAVIVYFVWRSIYTAIVIIRLANRSSDEELCANRYIISALSLGVGGFFTPFIVTSFPNVDTTSTIKPRYFLSKVMGLCILIGAPILGLAYFLPLLVGTNAVNNVSLIFAANSTMGIISIIVLTLTLLGVSFGALTTGLFFSKKSDYTFVNNNPSQLMKTISTIWMAILTVELVLVIVLAISRVIGALMDLFRMSEEGGGIIMMFFALLNLFITMSYVGMVIYITTRTMAGLWSIDGNIKIKKYRHNNYAQSRLYSGNMNV